MTSREPFFLDIFNNLLDFNNNKIYIVFDVNGDIWFGLKQLLSMLGYTSITKQQSNLKLDKKFLSYYSDIMVPQLSGRPLEKIKNFQKNTKFINESGLYSLLTKSNKPMAKTFLDKYYSEIMPQIRKTGKYISNEEDTMKIKKLNEKINNYKAELNYYNDKYEFVPSELGYIYINENKQTKNGVPITCYKIGYDTDMKKRIREYKVGNFKHKLLAYIPLKLDRKQIEQCVKNRLKPHLVKLVTDTVCYLSLKKLKNEIIDCINFTHKHVCHCVVCSKIYKINSLDKHKCNTYSPTDIITYNKPVKKSSKTPLKKPLKKQSKKSSRTALKKPLKKQSKKSSKK